MTQDISVVIIDSDSTTSDKIVKYVQRLNNNVSIAGVASGFEQGFSLIHDKKPQVVMFEVSIFDVDRSIEQIQRILESFPQISIFATCEDKSADIILKVMRAGAAEYILRPVSEIDLDSALQKTGRLRITTSAAPVKKGHIYTLYGPKGGVGVTTIATNLAIDLHKATKEPTILIDLDLDSGDVTTFLNMKTTYTISDVTSNMNRLDESFLKGVITKHETGVYVLAEPHRVEDGSSISGSDVRKLFSLLKLMFTHIVVDAENVSDERTVEAIEASDTVLLIFNLSLPGIKHTQRHLRFFEKIGVSSDRIKLLVNRYVKKGDILIPDAEKVLKHPVFWNLPNDYEAAMTALNKGVSIRDYKPKSPLGKSMYELAQTLLNPKN